ncbi:MAG TPA: glycosyltransferase family 39 protein [Opitutaceae bacterium]|nr:glycosyltransferase family 39 protein [Opitutaceae bacterium]
MFSRTLLRDRRLWLIVLLSALAFVVSRFAISGSTAISWVVNGGYWAILAATVLFARALWFSLREDFRGWRFRREHGAVLALVAVCGGLLLAHERYGFKVLADEELLVGTSMDMHYVRQVAYPIRATNIQGPFQVLQSVLDKRPFFYPFLVSLAHDLTGYRVENAFYVNTVLGFVFLGLAFVIGRRLGGSPWAGVLVVLLFAGLPLMAQQMTGGGFDLLNLVMLEAVLLLAIRLAERRDAWTQEALCYAGVLLAYTRYESALLLPFVALVVLWAWWREQRVTLSWPVIVIPAFLAFCLMQNRVFSLHEGSWELAGRPGATSVFGLQYVGENLGHALGFFFDTTGYQPNSPFFAAVGLLAVPFFGLWIVRVARTARTAAPADVAVALIGLGLFAIWALLMVYFWGQFDHPVIHRLSLPVHLLMALAVVVVGALFLRRRGWRLAAAAALVALVVYSLPVMARRAYTLTYSPAVEMEWRTDFLRRYPSRDYLFIDNDATFWIAHHIAATPAKQARLREEGLVYHLRNDTFSAMYVLQHFHVDPKTGVRTLDPADDIGPDFELDPVWEKRIETLFIGRISRITAIRQGGHVAARAGLVVTPPGAATPTRSSAEWDAAKKAYVDKFLKQLP